MRCLVVLALLVACGDDDGGTDAGDGGFDAPQPLDSALLDSGPPQCFMDVNCSDGVYCNGAEVCDADRVDADDMGCAPAVEMPCPVDQCLEDEARCQNSCDLMNDVDMDGSPSLACGGTDCDDNDPAINRGATEICESVGVDENCDGTVNEGCTCTTAETRACSLPGLCAAGIETCTSDEWGECSIAPITEVCGDGLDQDCDGTSDEGC